MIYVADNTFLLHGKHTTYAIGRDDEGRLYHLHYGKRLNNHDHAMHRYAYRGQSAMDINRKDRSAEVLNDVGWAPKDSRGISLDESPQEYPAFGKFDLRSPAYQLELAEGNRITDARLVSYRIESGKPVLPGMPSASGSAEEAQTLILTLHDEVADFEIDLFYTVYRDYDVICRRACLRNTGNQVLKIQHFASASMDFAGRCFDSICFPGAWSRERAVCRQPVSYGIQTFATGRGSSSHQMNPFVILCSPDATEMMGEAYGYSLIYSGNHATTIERDSYDVIRIHMGLNPATFAWTLAPGELFHSPECVIAYSAEGLNHLSQTYHRFYQQQLIPARWRECERPIVINNWEATYFDFDEEKILKIARIAHEVGVELFVLDDGWFGERNTDHCSLGDWVVNLKKLPNGLKGLAQKLKEIGMRFGIWMEPEMISPDSDLYRAHPDWAIRVPGRDPSITRWQYVLDLTNPQVRRYIIDTICGILSDAEISYIKWDMNRHQTDLPNMEFAHRYMLGLYEILDEVTSRFPHVLLEGCAGGGGRFDPAMLHYIPQIWTSDDSDAMERLKIQYGTSFAYPLSTMSAHVSDTPNHQTGRVTALRSRGDVASFGQFGYEMDITQLDPDQLDELKQQTALYRQIRPLIQNGIFHRLVSPFEGNLCAWQLTAPDRSLCFALFSRVLSVPNAPQTIFKLVGLDEDAEYEDVKSGRVYDGRELMNYGLSISFLARDFDTVTMLLKKKQPHA